MDGGINSATPKMNWESEDLPGAWKNFHQHVEFVFKGPLSTKTEEVQCNYLMLWVGEKGRNIFSTWGMDDDDKKKLKEYYDRFEKYVEPKSNKVFARYKFQSKVQSEAESAEQFIGELKILVKNCGYQNPDEMIRDRIVFGTKSNRVREKLINEGSELTLQKAEEITRLHEMSTAQLKTMADDSTASTSDAIHAINLKHNPNKNSDKKITGCWNCGTDHPIRQCPAYGQKCHLCKGWNHYAKKCKKANKGKNTDQKGQRGQRKKHHKRQINAVDDYETRERREDSDSDSATQFFIHAVQNTMRKSDNAASWNIKLKTNNKTINCKIDTGAQCNVLPKSVFESLKVNNKLNKSKAKLVAYSGHPLKTVGKVTIECEYKNKFYPITFQVVKGASCPIIGAATSENELKIIKRIYSVVDQDQILDNALQVKNEKSMKLTESNLLSEYKDVFEGLGCMEGEVEIKLKQNAIPVVNPPRNVPVALHDKLKNKLDNMVKMGVLTRVSEPTEWVNSMVTVVKPSGELRVCLDPRNLNQAICREHFPMKTIDSVLSKVKNAQYFSVFDASSGYWQLKLSEQSSKYCTFNTPYGRFRYLRMPFGINCAAEIFQRRMSALFENIEGVEVVVDDILIWGCSEMEHDARIRRVMEIVRKHNVKLNKEKCKFKKQQVSYLGHILTTEGLKPDPEKVKAVLDMPSPTDKPGLQRFLGMVNYLSKFIPNMSEIASPLRSLLCKEILWEWSNEQEKCFRKLKEVLCTAPVLAYYDPKIPVTLSVDASSKGLGATILQKDKPVAYASKALTKAECNYAQIEKELLAIVYGCKKFHNYIACRKVEVESDHKPLEIIMKKPLHKAPLRLQRMLMQLQRYDLDVKYKKGVELHIADTLSRAYLPEEGEPLEGPLEIYNIQNQIPMSPDKFMQFQKATAEDPSLVQLSNLVQGGWPVLREQCPSSCLEYWNFRDELSVVNGVLFKGVRVLVPKVLKPEMLRKIHEAHQGALRCKLRAREALFWPGMMRDIDQVVSFCDVCNENARRQAKQPLISHEIPDQPWAKVSSDLFEFKGKHYMLCVDYYSKYPEVTCLGSEIKARVIIDTLKSVFSRHGIPIVLISDNGPQYVNEEFKKFTRSWEFKHETSSPRYPRSNGQVERMVQTVKGFMAKSDEPHLALLEYRNTPIPGIGYSPSQMLMGRRLNAKIPINKRLLNPESISRVKVHKQIQIKQEEYKRYYDRQTKYLRPLKMGEGVRIWNEKTRTWQPAMVLSQTENPRSYTVHTQAGRNLRRNRQDIKPSPEVSLRTSQETSETEPNAHPPPAATTESIPQQNTQVTPTIINSPSTPVKSTPSKSQHNTPAPTQTRSGRTIRIPERYKD